MVSTYVALEGNEMLRATVEIISGNPARLGTPIPIGVLEADNVGGDDFKGDYDLRLFEHSNAGPTTCRKAKLEGFQRSKGAFSLVRAALAAFHK